MKPKTKTLLIYLAVLLALLIIVVAGIRYAPDRSPGRMDNEPGAAWQITP